MSAAAAATSTSTTATAAAAAASTSEEAFAFPEFHGYPPYFTLQPVVETRRKQLELWRALVLDYCRAQRLFIIPAGGAGFPPFANAAIDRRLSHEARLAVLEDLVRAGGGAWLDERRPPGGLLALGRAAPPGGGGRVLVLWRSVEEWAEEVAAAAAAAGLRGSVATLEELLAPGPPLGGTPAEGLEHELLLRALRALERRGRAKLFEGGAAGEVGVKFV
jgi:ESCRT-II complex subunit VPS25